MKILVKLFIIFCFLTVPSYAHDILVLPADLLQTKENYYSFDEPSEIIANDIIKEFNKTNGKKVPRQRWSMREFVRKYAGT